MKRLVMVIVCSHLLGIYSKHTQAPTPFWKFNRYDKADQSLVGKSMKDLFWSYFTEDSLDKHSVLQGTYKRDSPGVWHEDPNHNPLKIVAYHQPKTKANLSESQIITKTEILRLASRPQLSHGPRRRRGSTSDWDPLSSRDVLEGIKHLKQYLDVPLFCWKILINCHRFRRHVCCPVMPDFMKPQADGQDRKLTKRDTRRYVYVDPLFNIPLAHPSPFEYGRRSDSNPCARVDCYAQPDQQCCQVDRFFPIGPFVQTSLVENWTSALFALFGNRPFVYVIFKKILIISLGFVAVALWGLLGHRLGFIKLVSNNVKDEKDKLGKRRDFLEITDRIMLAVDGGKWMKRLEHLGDEDITSFLCCMLPDQDQVACYPSKGPKPHAQFRSTIDCVSDLLYDITLNKNLKTSKAEDPQALIEDMSNEVQRQDEPRDLKAD